MVQAISIPNERQRSWCPEWCSPYIFPRKGKDSGSPKQCPKTCESNAELSCTRAPPAMWLEGGARKLSLVFTFAVAFPFRVFGLSFKDKFLKRTKESGAQWCNPYNCIKTANVSGAHSGATVFANGNDSGVQNGATFVYVYIQIFLRKGKDPGAQNGATQIHSLGKARNLEARNNVKKKGGSKSENYVEFSPLRWPFLPVCLVFPFRGWGWVVVGGGRGWGWSGGLGGGVRGGGGGVGGVGVGGWGGWVGGGGEVGSTSRLPRMMQPYKKHVNEEINDSEAHTGEIHISSVRKQGFWNPDWCNLCESVGKAMILGPVWCNLYKFVRKGKGSGAHNGATHIIV